MMTVYMEVQTNINTKRMQEAEALAATQAQASQVVEVKSADTPS